MEWNHGHERKPAQAARLDEMTVRGAHWVAIDAARGDLAAPAPLDRIVDSDDYRPLGKNLSRMIVSSVRAMARLFHRAG